LFSALLRLLGGIHEQLLHSPGPGRSRRDRATRGVNSLRSGRPSSGDTSPPTHSASTVRSSSRPGVAKSRWRAAQRSSSGFGPTPLPFSFASLRVVSSSATAWATTGCCSGASFSAIAATTRPADQRFRFRRPSPTSMPRTRQLVGGSNGYQLTHHGDTHETFQMEKPCRR
jgi:hypothetical protein